MEVGGFGALLDLCSHDKGTILGVRDTRGFGNVLFLLCTGYVIVHKSKPFLEL